MSSLKDVAKLAGTSTATVSRVINQKGYVSDEIRAKVIKAIETLEYKPLSREKVRHKSRTIALVTPDIENPFFGKMTKEISKIANELKYNVMLINVGGLKNDGGTFLMSLIDTRVDGVLYASSYRLGDVIEKAKANDIPLVVLDREFKTIEVDSVAINNDQAGYIATEHLLGLGHRKIAFIGGHKNMEISKHRLDGYRRAIEEQGIGFDEKLVYDGDFSLKSGYEGAKALLAENPDITAFVTGNDLMAIGTLNYVNYIGYSIPEDLSIVGFDDIELATSITPKLTTVSYPLERMSRLAVDSLIKQIESKDLICESVILFPKLIVRDSTGVKPEEKET